MEITLFAQLSLLCILAVVVGWIMKSLKQPVIIGYIIVGSLISFLGITKTSTEIESFSHIGIIFLLFMIGLHLNPSIIKDVGIKGILIGLGQIIITAVLGYILSTLLGFNQMVSIIIAISLSFSSTIIVLKFLTDKEDTESVYGRLTLTILIIQDLVAGLVLILFPLLSNDISISSISIQDLLESGGLLVGLILISRFIIPQVLPSIARSQDFLLLFAIGWCMLFAQTFEYLHFSKEIGALVAGIILSGSAFKYELSSKIKPLRDFFVVIFFVLLGLQVSFGDIYDLIWPTIIFTAFVLIIKPIIVILLMGISKYTQKNSFFTGVSLAQISEFSLIFVALAIAQKNASPQLLSLMTMIGILTIGVSSYYMNFSHTMYNFLLPIRSIFGKKGEKNNKGQELLNDEEKYTTILFGCDRIGYGVLQSLKKRGEKILVVDFNPDKIKQLQKEGISCRYADAGDSDIFQELPTKDLKMVISTVKDFETNMLLIKKAKELNKEIILIVVSHQTDETLKLYDEGAMYVIMPHFLGSHYTSKLLEEYAFDFEKFLEEKNKHIEVLKNTK